jgi:Ribbon-helix-helix protein, copG family
MLTQSQMPKQTSGGKKMGRPATGKGTLVGVRIQPDDLAAIDAWAAAHGCNRAEAIRRLAKLGLLADTTDD